MKAKFGDGKQPVQVEEFDYEVVNRNLFGAGEDDQFEELNQEDVDRGVQALRKLLAWIWADGAKQPEGIQLRAMVCCWIFLKELRPLELTELAQGFGKHKQSLGRQVDAFKVAFPRIRVPHMQ